MEDFFSFIPMLPSAQLRWLYLGLNVLFIFLFADADPFWFKACDDVHDAAWWADPARLKITHDIWMSDGFAGALAVGPLSVAWHYLVFSIASTGLMEVRLLSMIPAVLVVFLLFRKAEDGRVLRALLLFPLWLAYARSGLPEIMQAAALLWMAQSLEQSSTRHWWLLGAALGAATLFKISFIYLLPSPFLALWMHDGGFIRNKQFALAGGMALVLFAALFIWYLPQHELFAPFLNAFSADYFSTAQLLHPTGIIARWVYAAQKPFWADPLIIMSLLLVVYSLSRDGRIHAFMLLFLPALLLMSFSDFTSRRFVPLMPMLLVMAHSNPSISLQGKTRKILELTLALLLFWHYVGLFDTGYRLMGFADGYFHLQPAGWLILIVFPAFMSWRYMESPEQGSPQLAPISAVLIGIAGVRANNPSVDDVAWAPFMVLIFGLILYFSVSMARAFLLACGLLICWSGWKNLEFNERRAIAEFSTLTNASSRVAGNTGAFSLALQSKAVVMHYPQHLSDRAQPNILAGISTSDQDAVSLNALLDSLGQQYGLPCTTKLERLVWNGRHSVIIRTCANRP